MRIQTAVFTGFTLIELLITLAIIAITTMVAAAIYIQFSGQGRRADGINALLTLSLAEERYRSTNTQYGTLAQLALSSTSPQGYYVLSISNLSATSYTLTATAQGNQTTDTQNGTSCTPLLLTVSNGTSTTTPAVCWPT